MWRRACIVSKCNREGKIISILRQTTAARVRTGAGVWTALIQTPAFKLWWWKFEQVLPEYERNSSAGNYTLAQCCSMNGNFGTAKVAEVGKFQVAEASENRYDYTLPV